MSVVLGERLRSLRENRGFTQNDLGERLGVTGAAIGQWENSRRYPDSSMLEKLADLFGVSVDYLLGRDPARASVDPAPQDRAILRSLNGLGEAARAEILEYIAWKRAQKRRKDADQADNPVTPEGGPRP